MREVEFFAKADDTQLLVEVAVLSEARRAAVRAWAEDLRAAMPEIAGVVAFRESEPGRKAARRKILTVGADHLIYQTQRAAYRVSAGSFFQTNRHLTDELVEIVTAGQSGELALDLYAGVGLFSTALAVTFITSFLLSRHRLPQPIFPTISPRMEKRSRPQRSSTWPVRKIGSESGRAQSSLIFFISPT